jgi:hypothetical protein
MKRAVKVAIVAAMLQGSAHAAEKAVASVGAAQGDKEKVATVRHVTQSVKRAKMADRKAGKQAKAEKAVPDTTVKQQEVTETPPDIIEQTVQLKGVRG